MGRPALINNESIRDVAHLDLLTETERKIVEMRWGLTTGSEATQRQASEKLSIPLDDLRVIERQAAIKIQRHVERKDDLDEMSALKVRVDELEEIVSALDAIMPYVKTSRKPVKRRAVKS